ncbi:condensin complex subunit 2 isoform X2 [Amborella trichopoda]|uniref:condensin complex subunit 2 isoform X2 n=1 Tax=Amborella trichopoda TaxID=13333 RepID=UPI0009BEB028|nr:condensin complex subunit 2 isoform X2 [Amborella trichopoda]|eukprot:XP_020519572.1 condensin complex subunit 2 isoform X2 [Amborella trichopoda]
MGQRTPVSARLQFTPPSRLLGSNDDELERAQARAERLLASRRKSFVGRPDFNSAHFHGDDDLLDKDQILQLFNNCIKLASENKINQKNTWELSLIDHLSDIIKVEDDDAETNFQKASCTLEAGVKIYSLRVDSVHSEAYKVLGGINRAGREDNDSGRVVQDDDIDAGQEGAAYKKEPEKKSSPLSTLESSFEALNIKKFDVAFTVDPLYHQTSAQFDEGGAKGLLLNNLGVYGGCRVVFDSSEAPGKNMSCATQSQNSDVIDISFAREYIEQMMMDWPAKNEISPTLNEIIKLFDEHNQRPGNYFPTTEKAMGHEFYLAENVDEYDDDGFNNHEPLNFDNDDQASVVDDVLASMGSNIESYNQDAFGDPYVLHEADNEETSERTAEFLLPGLGFLSKSNAWAGPDHWKFRKVKGSEEVLDSSNNPLMETKRPKNKNTLPEDCHYQPENLVKLFLLPCVMCIGKKRKKTFAFTEDLNTFESVPSWDAASDISSHHDNENIHSDNEDSSDLVSKPRQVNKIEVQYDKTSKQVDVHSLKGTLWECLQNSVEKIVVGNKAALLFSQVLRTLPQDCPAAAPEDISPHLCFICLLHLANEHGLTIKDCATLDELYIEMPPRTESSVGVEDVHLTNNQALTL